MVFVYECRIDQSAKKIWPCFLDIEAWMADLRYERKEGEPGQEGEIRLVTSQGSQEDEGNAPSKYLIKTIKVTPLQQYVVKVTGQGFSGYADFSFTQSGGCTHIIYDVYLEFLISAVSEEDFRSQTQKICHNSKSVIDKNNLTLKALMEESVQAK